MQTPCRARFNRDSAFDIPPFQRSDELPSTGANPPRKLTSSDVPAFQNGTVAGHRLILAAEPVQALLHFVELTLEIIHFAARSLRFLGRFRLAARERRKHGKCLFEHFHIAPYLILEGAKSADTEGLGHLLAKFPLLLRQRFN